MQIIEKSITELREYGNNPRINDQAVDVVAASIREFGFKVPVIIDAEGVIVCGHTRVKAANKLGLATVPCIIADDLNPEQIKAFRLADNKVAEASTWDFAKLEEELAAIDVSLLNSTLEDFGFDSAFLESFPEDENKELEEPDVPEVDPEAPTTCQPGDIWQLGNHRLMCGDSTDKAQVQKLMNGIQADLLLTDPPYNVSYNEKNKILNKADKGNRVQVAIENDKMENAEFYNFLDKVFKAAADSMKPGAAFYCWFASREHINFRTALQAAGLEVKEELIWVKNNFVLGLQDYQWQHEPCLYGWKGGAGHYFIDRRNLTTILEDPRPEIEEMKKSELVDLLNSIYDAAGPTTVIRENKPQSSKDHPTMKPVKLFGRQVMNSTRKGWRVLDLFGGSGTTILACEQLGRFGYSMEYSPHYCDVIIKRWEELTGKQAERVEAGKPSKK